MKYFDQIPSIKYEGAKSLNPFAFKYYDPDEVILGKPMKEHLKFSMAYWHTMTGEGVDPFGQATMERDWDACGDPIEKAKIRVKAAFELMEKLRLEYFCFHDRDLAPNRKPWLRPTVSLMKLSISLKRNETNQDQVALGNRQSVFQQTFRQRSQHESECRCLRLRRRAGQKALEITKRLKGSGYVFWGGREGYETLLNTDLKLEQDNLARFFHMAVDYAKEIGFKGTILY